MKHASRRFSLVFTYLTILCYCTWCGVAVRATESSSGRLENTIWTPQDSVQLRYYSLDHENGVESLIRPSVEDGDSTSGGVTYNSDGRYCFTIQHFGDVEADLRVCDLKIWKLDDVASAIEARAPSFLRPFRTLRASTSEGADEKAAIQSARFIGSDEIAYLAPNAERDGAFNVHSFSVRNATLRALTNFSENVLDYVFVGNAIAVTMKREVAEDMPPLEYPMHTVELARFGPFRNRLVESRQRTAYRESSRTIRHLVSSINGGTVSEKWIELSYLPTPGAFSPDGRYVIGSRLGKESEKLSVLGLTEDAKDLVVAVESRNLRDVCWSSDSRFVLISIINSGNKYVGENQVICLDMDSGIHYNTKGLVIADGRSVSYANRDGREWEVKVLDKSTKMVGIFSAIQTDDKMLDFAVVKTEKEVEVRRAHDLKVYIEQGDNTPPRLIARNTTGVIILQDTDPLLKRKVWAPTRELVWKDANGRTQVAGLRIPKERPEGVRFPVVVSFEYVDPGLFLPDGAFKGTTSAAQSFVSAGFAVVQVNRKALISSPGNENDIGKHFDALMEVLGIEEWADAQNVGVVGFSRAGYNVQYLVSYPGKWIPSAAIACDSFAGGFPTMLDLHTPGAYSAYFWDSKDAWLEHDVLFNVERVRTPILFTDHSSDAMVTRERAGLRLWDRDEYKPHVLDRLSAYKLNKRAVEYVVFPDGAHQLRRPREQIALHELAVEWMNFWLKRENPPDLDRAGRWAILRRQQDEVLKTPPPPRGKWVFQPDPVQPEWANRYGPAR